MEFVSNQKGYGIDQLRALAKVRGCEAGFNNLEISFDRFLDATLPNLARKQFGDRVPDPDLLLQLAEVSKRHRDAADGRVKSLRGEQMETPSKKKFFLLSD